VAVRQHAAISVIVATYNRAELLPATLDGILTQTTAPREVIVVDDGSFDQTQAVLAQYGGRIRTMRIVNSGKVAARNVGLLQAAGDFVAFCDSGDLWKPTYLTAMARMWWAEPSLRVAFGDFLIVQDGIWQTQRKFADAPPGFWSDLRSIGPMMSTFDNPIVDRLLDFQPFFPSCMVADRRFLLDIGGWDASAGRILGADFATVLRLAEHTPFGIMQQSLAGIRKQAAHDPADVQAMKLGDAQILEHVLQHRPSLEAHAGAIRSSIVQRRHEALELAFARRDFPAVRDIARLLPTERQPWRLRVKSRVAAWPAPLRGVASGALLAAGSALSAARRWGG
jgi:glycosyltransferase involved in cell wall biosynthesis